MESDENKFFIAEERKSHLGEHRVFAVQVLHVVSAHREEKLRAVGVGHAHVGHRHQPHFVMLTARWLDLVFEKPSHGTDRLRRIFLFRRITIDTTQR